MDDQKRKKVMLGVLAFAAIAGGGYYFMNSGSGEADVKDVSASFTGRQKREATTASTGRVARKKRAPAAREKITTGRKERTVKPTAKTTRRSRRGKAKKTKKKKLVPAA